MQWKFNVRISHHRVYSRFLNSCDKFQQRKNKCSLRNDLEGIAYFIDSVCLTFPCLSTCSPSVSIVVRWWQSTGGWWLECIEVMYEVVSIYVICSTGKSNLHQTAFYHCYILKIHTERVRPLNTLLCKGRLY